MSDCDFLELLLKYPLLRAIDGGFEGIIEAADSDYELYVRTNPTDGSFAVATTPQLEPHKKQIAELERGGNLIALLDGLVKILSANTKSTADPSEVYWTVLNEYVDFRQFYFNLKSCSIQPDLSTIAIKMVDEQNRPHDLVVSVNFDGPSDAIFIVKDDGLPATNEEKDTDARYGSLKALYERFICKIESLQAFFDIMDVIDSECWVLDPENPRRADVHRRISLGNNVSVLLTFSPYSVPSLPDIKLLGPERLVRKYHDSLDVNLQDWTPSENVLQDLVELLGIECFPRRPPQEEEAKGNVLLYDTGDCCICYSKRLNDKLPEIICSNKSCENSFHAECLYQWLISINAQRSFNEISGQCPICEQTISCPLPDRVT